MQLSYSEIVIQRDNVLVSAWLYWLLNVSAGMCWQTTGTPCPTFTSVLWERS